VTKILKRKMMKGGEILREEEKLKIKEFITNNNTAPTLNLKVDELLELLINAASVLPENFKLSQYNLPQDGDFLTFKDKSKAIAHANRKKEQFLRFKRQLRNFYDNFNDQDNVADDDTIDTLIHNIRSQLKRYETGKLTNITIGKETIPVKTITTDFEGYEKNYEQFKKSISDTLLDLIIILKLIIVEDDADDIDAIVEDDADDIDAKFNKLVNELKVIDEKAETFRDEQNKIGSSDRRAAALKLKIGGRLSFIIAPITSDDEINFYYNDDYSIREFNKYNSIMEKKRISLTRGRSQPGITIKKPSTYKSSMWSMRHGKKAVNADTTKLQKLAEEFFNNIHTDEITYQKGDLGPHT
jgi:hypothetical protein